MHRRTLLALAVIEVFDSICWLTLGFLITYSLGVL